MAVYVDDARWPWRGRLWCHMVADDLDELHEFAERIGLRRAWFQYPKSRYPHYDLNENRRWLAVKMGAVEIDSRVLVEKSKALRNAADIDHILRGPPTKGRRRGSVN